MTSMPGLEGAVSRGSDPQQDFGLGEQARRPSRVKMAVTSIVIICSTLLLLLAGIDKPTRELFDESMYVGVSRSLLKGTLGPMPQEFSAATTVGRQHPPLGSYLIAAGITVAGDKPLGWRLASVVCGVLTLVAIFFWTYLLLRDYSLAVTATALTLFNNFLYVMSRTAMLDVFVFTFVIWGILVFTMAVELEVSQRARSSSDLGFRTLIRPWGRMQVECDRYARGGMGHHIGSALLRKIHSPKQSQAEAFRRKPSRH